MTVSDRVAASAATLPFPAPGVPVLPGTGLTVRLYRGLDDVPGMAAANQRLRTRAGVLEPVDPDAMRHRYTHLVNSDPLRDCLVAERGGETCGYVRAEWHDLADGDRSLDVTVVVEPASWGLDLGAGLLAWGEDRLRAIAATLGGGRRTWLESWTFDGDEELRAALLAAGYERVRHDAEMLRPDLEAIPEAGLADGYTLRTPEPDELPAVFAMVVASFQEHWGEAVAEDQRIEEWTDDPRFRRDLVVVAWRGDEPVACVSSILEPRPDGSVRALVDAVCTHPAHRRRGLARAAIVESLRRLRSAGASSAYLGVDTDNHNRALDLYMECGFRVASRSASYRRLLEPAEPGR